MPKVADFIDSHRELLTQRYLEEASKLESARGLKPYQVIDTVPEYLGTLAAISREGHRGDLARTKQRLEEMHIGLRLMSGYNQEEATSEYVLLGRLLSSLWEHLPREEQPSSEDMALLFEELQDAMNHVGVTFSGYSLEDRQREKRALRQLDTLSAEVIGDVESPVPLQERMGALVEVVRQALRGDGALLLLADPTGTRLLPVAHTGCWSALEGLAPVPVDAASFLGRVACSEEPLELADASSTELALPEGVRHGGVRSMLGLRLWPHGKLLGALAIGVRQLRPFEPQTRRYFETLVEYLSGIIQKALLLEQLRHSHERVRQSETLHRLATAAISDATWDWNLREDTVVWSGGVERIFGYRAEELSGPISGWYDHIHPEDLQRVSDTIHAVIDGGGERWRDEYRFRHRDGHYLYVIDHGLVERDARGEPVRMVGAMQDITATQRAVEALRVSEDRLRMTLRAADLGTWDMNPATGALRWDERCKAFFGLPPEAEVTYATFLGGMHPEDRERAEAMVRRSLAGENGGEYDTEYRIVSPATGEERWLRAMGRAFFEEGRAVRFMGTVQDITDRKRQQTEVSTRAVFAEQLIGIVSHDLRNPLNAILLSVTAMLRREEVSERQAKALARISSAAERSVRLIHDLLDFTRARLGGGISLTRRPADLHRLTQHTVEEVRLVHPERQIELVHDGPATGEWDEDRLAQVVTNLVNNALAYSPPESRVRVETRGEEGAVVLRVHNWGEPIPPALLPRLFEPMTRGGETGSAARSIGLGLYIVTSIVRAHGGTVEVHSTASEGTTFTVRLPRPRGTQAA